MNISKREHRVLTALAQGGRIMLLRDDNRKLLNAELYNRDGWLMTNCDLSMFKQLKAKKAIASTGGKPYRITRDGIRMMTAFDNR
ncbi:hypothetical protein VW29_14990 [Devosia limi DSM 17137]|uniref:Uncharacterized protein n=1 Tax=Devosia limi DSM 17137 TaxID=1121477 RepID=A0A0F5LKI0_9HYPH|nr:YjhX family toxin [Devosia limi]KKB82858.1 hypothetical protein VW29_14990 [Devosia limi DSM 17137]SHF49519.1 hypothetical protein SAMN02745223_02802 [Devosia limi DSM 17137]